MRNVKNFKDVSFVEVYFRLYDYTWNLKPANNV